MKVYRDKAGRLVIDHLGRTLRCEKDEANGGFCCSILINDIPSGRSDTEVSAVMRALKIAYNESFKTYGAHSHMVTHAIEIQKFIGSGLDCAVMEIPESEGDDAEVEDVCATY